MNAPPGLATSTTTGGTTSAENRIRHAHVILANCGVSMGSSKVSRLVREYEHRVERNGFAFFDFLVNAVQVSDDQRRLALASPEVQRVISYADPTGETAVRHVMRARGQR